MIKNFKPEFGNSNHIEAVKLIAKIAAMKKSARKVFEENFTRDHSVGAYLNILEKAANS